MADKNTTSNINLAAAEELPKAQSKFKEFVKIHEEKNSSDFSGIYSFYYLNGNHRTVCSSV